MPEEQPQILPRYAPQDDNLQKKTVCRCAQGPLDDNASGWVWPLWRRGTLVFSKAGQNFLGGGVGAEGIGSELVDLAQLGEENRP